MPIFIFTKSKAQFPLYTIIIIIKIIIIVISFFAFNSLNVIPRTDEYMFLYYASRTCRYQLVLHGVEIPRCILKFRYTNLGKVFH